MINLNNFSKQVDELIFYLDDIEGNKLFRQIKREGMKLIQQDQEKQGAFLVLQFLIIPFLSTREVSNLLRENLYVGLSIDDMDLTERITKKLLKLDISDRDNCKKELKNALANNKEQITDEAVAEGGKKLKFISDWIKDYVSNTNKNSGQTLGNAQYFYQKNYFNKLDDDDKAMLKKLFKLYEFLNISSKTPAGFEDDILIKTEDGKLITTSKGQIITLYDYNKGEGTGITRPKARTITGPPQTKSEKKIDELKQEEKQYVEGGLEEKALEEEIGKEKEIENLQYMADKYPEGSLERKAVRDEIRKLGT